MNHQRRCCHKAAKLSTGVCMATRKNEQEPEVHSPCGSRSPAAKVAMVRNSPESQASVSLVAARHGVKVNHLFYWREFYQQHTPAAATQ